MENQTQITLHLLRVRNGINKYNNNYQKYDNLIKIAMIIYNQKNENKNKKH